jgi:hypothetical protein
MGIFRGAEIWRVFLPLRQPNGSVVNIHFQKPLKHGSASFL